jgi:hypothetical protein
VIGFGDRKKAEETLEKLPTTPYFYFDHSTPADSSTMSIQSTMDDTSRYEEHSTPVNQMVGNSIKENGTAVEGGIIFIEGQLKDNISSSEIEQVCVAIMRDCFIFNFFKMQNVLEARLFAVDFSFQVDENLLADEDSTFIHIAKHFTWKKS